MAHENRTKLTPIYGNRRESGIVKGDSDQVWGNVSQNTIPINQSRSCLLPFHRGAYMVLLPTTEVSIFYFTLLVYPILKQEIKLD